MGVLATGSIAGSVDSRLAVQSSVRGASPGDEILGLLSCHRRNTGSQRLHQRRRVLGDICGDVVVARVDIELIAERRVLAGDAVECGDNLRYSGLPGLTGNETPVDRAGAFPWNHIVGNTGLDRINADD